MHRCVAQVEARSRSSHALAGDVQRRDTQAEIVCTDRVNKMLGGQIIAHDDSLIEMCSFRFQSAYLFLTGRIGDMFGLEWRDFLGDEAAVGEVSILRAGLERRGLSRRRVLRPAAAGNCKRQWN